MFGFDVDCGGRGKEAKSRGQGSGQMSRCGSFISPDMDSPVVTRTNLDVGGSGDLKVIVEYLLKLSTIRGCVWCSGGRTPPPGGGSPGSLRAFGALRS